MLNIQCAEYLATVRTKADELGLRDRLEERLTYLAEYANKDGEGGRGADYTRCDLFKDFAPLSFAFVMYRKDALGEYIRWFNGGCIFFGAGDTGVGAPQFSVRIGESNAGWSIHT